MCRKSDISIEQSRVETIKLAYTIKGSVSLECIIVLNDIFLITELKGYETKIYGGKRHNHK